MESLMQPWNLAIKSSKASLFSALLFIVFFFESTALAAPAPATAPASAQESGSVKALELDRAIQSVLSRPEFSWRMPRAKIEHGDEPGWFVSFVRSAFEMVGDWVRAVVRFAKKVSEWIFEKLFNKLRSPLPGGGGGTDWMTSLQLLLYCLTAFVVAVLAILAMRMWRRRRSRIEEVFATAIPAAPDLSDENVLANELPEESWLKIGRELMERGEMRLALRAFYLAALAHLGRRELIRIARFKSNHDYEMELRRRAHSRPDLLGAFAETVRLFDRVWYGRHEITAGDLNGFQTSVERIAAC
jgi:hypothetical protein